MAETSRIMRLPRELTLRDVYAICTGAMFSSGFFLLPGIAFAFSGAWMILAYALSALLVVPAMLSKAELATAMPKAGGTYFFLDRALGPIAGTVGGVGTWIAMGLKNTFALIGMGAYVGLVMDVDITSVAVVLTVVFTAINIVGAKETATLQRILVDALVAVLVFFVVAGLVDIGGHGFIERTKEVLDSAPKGDIDGFLATVGLVFVSYAGLTKVAGVAEEVDQPGRNIMLGMTLSLMTALTIYTAGSFVVVMTVDHDALPQDLTPIATAAVAIFEQFPKAALYVVLVGAVAAFASTANAGIMASSRYLLAMGRDRLVPSTFGKLNRLGTPTLAVLVTGGFIVTALLTLDVVSVAKLASAFQLLMFALVNLAVIVMRESRLSGYDPKYKSPFYPWVQVAGIFASLGLIVELGRMSILFTLLLGAVSVGWFFFYAKPRVVRHGAILHWFERLGRDRFDALETELREIVIERGLNDGDELDRVIAAAPVLDLDERAMFPEVAAQVAELLKDQVPLETELVVQELVDITLQGMTPIVHGAALPHMRVDGLERSVLALVRAPQGVVLEVDVPGKDERRQSTVRALFILISPEQDSGQHLRMLARLATAIEREAFQESWLAMEHADDLREALAGHNRVWELARAMIVAREDQDKVDRSQ